MPPPRFRRGRGRGGRRGSGCSRSEEGPEPALLAVGGQEHALLQEPGEVRLREVLRRVGVVALAADEGVDRIPVGPAELGQGLAVLGRGAEARRGDQAPAGGGEVRDASGRGFIGRRSLGPVPGGRSRSARSDAIPTRRAPAHPGGTKCEHADRPSPRSARRPPILNIASGQRAGRRRRTRPTEPAMRRSPATLAPIVLLLALAAAVPRRPSRPSPSSNSPPPNTRPAARP